MYKKNIENKYVYCEKSQILAFCNYLASAILAK